MYPVFEFLRCLDQERQIPFCSGYLGFESWMEVNLPQEGEGFCPIAQLSIGALWRWILEELWLHKCGHEAQESSHTIHDHAQPQWGVNLTFNFFL